MTTLYQREILKELHKGAVIIVEYITSPPSEAHCIYRLSYSLRAVPPATVKRLLDERLIRSNQDALFADALPQSYSLWRASEGGA